MQILKILHLVFHPRKLLWKSKNYISLLTQKSPPDKRAEWGCFMLSYTIVYMLSLWIIALGSFCGADSKRGIS